MLQEGASPWLWEEQSSPCHWYQLLQPCPRCQRRLVVQYLPYCLVPAITTASSGLHSFPCRNKSLPEACFAPSPLVHWFSLCCPCCSVREHSCLMGHTLFPTWTRHSMSLPSPQCLTFPPYSHLCPGHFVCVSQKSIQAPEHLPVASRQTSLTGINQRKNSPKARLK